MKKTKVGVKSRGERGIQLTEMAVLLPIMFTLLAAITEFGNYFYTYTTLTKATRVASRYLSGHMYVAGEIATAKNLALCGSLTTCANGSQILPGLTTANIDITYTGSAFRPTTVTAQIINYNYASVFNLAGFIPAASLANIAVAPKTTMRYTLEY